MSPVTSIAPLVFVVAVTSVKQAYEDWLRHKADLQVNNRAVRVLRNGELHRIKAKDVMVFQLIKTKERDVYASSTIFV